MKSVTPVGVRTRLATANGTVPRLLHRKLCNEGSQAGCASASHERDLASRKVAHNMHKARPVPCTSQTIAMIACITVESRGPVLTTDPYMQTRKGTFFPTPGKGNKYSARISRNQFRTRDTSPAGREIDSRRYLPFCGNCFNQRISVFQVSLQYEYCENCL